MRIDAKVVAGLLLAGWLGVACMGGSGGSGGPTVGSESHFLERCSPGDCGTGLECLCGVCTRTCVTDDACGDLEGGAKCFDVGGSGGVKLDCTDSSSVSAVCAVGCKADAECENVGPQHTCEAGVCTAPPSMTPVAGAGGSGGQCGSVTCKAPEVCCPCGNFCASPGDGTCPEMCQGSGGMGAGGVSGLDCGPEPYDCAVPDNWCAGNCCAGFKLRTGTCCPECVPIDPTSECTLECTLIEAGGENVCECVRDKGSECTMDADCAIAGNWGTCCPTCADAYPSALVDTEACLKSLDEETPSGCGAQVDGCAQGDTKPPSMCPDVSCPNAPYAACVDGSCKATECPAGMVQALGRCFPGCKTDTDCAWATVSTGCCDGCPAIFPAAALDDVRCLVAPGETVPADCRPADAVCTEREMMHGPCSPQTCTTPALACQPDGTCAVK